MYLRRIDADLYQDIKVLTHYCSTIGKPISGLDTLKYPAEVFRNHGPLSGKVPNQDVLIAQRVLKQNR